LIFSLTIRPIGVIFKTDVALNCASLDFLIPFIFLTLHVGDAVAGCAGPPRRRPTPENTMKRERGADMMQGGLDWADKPRATRSKPATPAVTRKSKDSVVTISKEAEAMLTAVFGSANFATEHAKRKTLQVDDMRLVQSIIGKSGSYARLL